jgi:hypothetical protein
VNNTTYPLISPAQEYCHGLHPPLTNGGTSHGVMRQLESHPANGLAHIRIPWLLFMLET